MQALENQNTTDSPEEEVEVREVDPARYKAILAAAEGKGKPPAPQAVETAVAAQRHIMRLIARNEMLQRRQTIRAQAQGQAKNKRRKRDKMASKSRARNRQ